MDEQVMIDLLEANKKLPAQEDVLQRFRDDFVDRVQTALTNPSQSVAQVKETRKPAAVAETVMLRQVSVDTPASDSWSFAEDTNAAGIESPEEAPEQAAANDFEPAQADEPVDAGLEFQDAAAPVQDDLPEETPEETPEAADSPSAELSGEASPDLESADFAKLQEQQAAVAMATEALLVQGAPEEAPDGELAPVALEDDMMAVPEELTRPEGTDGDKGEGGKKKKKKKR